MRVINGIKSIMYSLFKLNNPPIIIGGCGRTGTSLMSAILGAHPAIVALNFESNAYVNIHRNNSLYVRISQLLRLYLLIIRQGVDISNRRFCEKTPRNVRAISEINSIYNHNAKIILMIRNGRDVLTSKHPNLIDKYYISLDRWVFDTELTLKRANDPNVLVVPYELLINDFNLTLINICFFLGIKYTNRFEQYANYTSVKSHGAFHKGKPEDLYNTSIERWKNAKHKQRVAEIKNSPKILNLLAKVDDFIENQTILFNQKHKGESHYIKKSH